jgi:hypothetical protein
MLLLASMLTLGGLSYAASNLFFQEQVTVQTLKKDVERLNKEGDRRQSQVDLLGESRITILSKMAGMEATINQMQNVAIGIFLTLLGNVALSAVTFIGLRRIKNNN